MLTWPFLAVTAPLCCPESTFTTCWCAARFASSQAVANSGLATIFATWSWTNPSTPLLIGGASACSCCASRGGSPWPCSRSSSCRVRAETST